MSLQPVTPVIVKIVEAPTQEIGVADVLVKSFGIVGLLLLGALVCGAALGGLLVLLKLWRPENALNGQVARSYFDIDAIRSRDSTTDQS